MLHFLLVPAVLAKMVAEDNLHFYVSGNDLLRECTSKTVLSQQGCMAYLQGVADSIGVARTLAGQDACMEPSVTAGQLRDVTVQYLQRNPANRNLPASQQANNAFREAWHC